MGVAGVVMICPSVGYKRTGVGFRKTSSCADGGINQQHHQQTTPPPTTPTTTPTHLDLTFLYYFRGAPAYRSVGKGRVATYQIFNGSFLEVQQQMIHNSSQFHVVTGAKFLQELSVVMIETVTVANKWLQVEGGRNVTLKVD